MKQFTRYIKSDGYKMIHSSLLLVHLLLPILGISVFLWYYTSSCWDQGQKILVYFQVLGMVFPFLIGIVTVGISEQELQAGSFQMLLCTPSKKSIPLFSKLVVLLIFGILSSLLAVLGFGIIFRAMGNVLLPISLYVKVATLIFFGNLPLYVLQYILSFTFGKGMGLGLGIVGSLLSALLITGLGEGIWWFLPWGISIRFASILVESKVMNKIFVQYSGVDKGMWFVGICTMVLFLILNLWSKNWEGLHGEYFCG